MFYYTAQGDFISEGTYSATYLKVNGDAALQQGGGTFSGQANYNLAFPQYLRSVTVERVPSGDEQTINPGGGGPLGISGTVFVGNDRFRGATLTLVKVGNLSGAPFPSPVVIYSVKTNENGFYSFYYDPDNVSAGSTTGAAGRGFIRPGRYRVAALVPGFSQSLSREITYDPQTTGAPTNSSGPQTGYFVNGAKQTALFCLGSPAACRIAADGDVLVSDALGDGAAAADDADGALSRAAPDVFGITELYPNPFSSELSLRYALRQSGSMDLAVYDLLGRRVATLEEGRREAGVHTVNARLSGLASGSYLVRLSQGDAVSTQKITLVE